MRTESSYSHLSFSLPFARGTTTYPRLTTIIPREVLRAGVIAGPESPTLVKMSTSPIDLSRPLGYN